MTIKELLHKIEAANFIAENTLTRDQYCVTCDFIDHDNFEVSFAINNADKSSHFKTWREFRDTIEDEFTNELREFVLRASVTKKGDFFYANSEHYALRFIVWHS